MRRRPGYRPSARWAALAAVAVLALGACAEETAPPSPLPSSAFPDDTGAISTLPPETGPTGGTGSLPTGPTGVLPTTSPGAATGNLSTGQAAITVSCDVRASKALANLISSVYAPPPSGMAIVWTSGGTDATTFGIGGLSFTGTQPTAPTLSLTLTVQTTNSIASFVSTAGECDITIGVASAGQISGVFTCSDLVGSSGEVVDASGSFSAQG